MKKIIFLIFATLLLYVSCETRYSYASMTIENNTTHKMIYKGLVRDEMSGDTTGDWIIKIKNPNYSPLSPNDKDTISHTWKDGYDTILFAVYWGFDTTTDYSVYDNTMDYIEIHDGENVRFRIDGTTPPNITRKRL